MRKISIMIVAALCAVFFAGCAGMQISTKTQYKDEKISYIGNPAAHINASNWGIYLFTIPLLSGSTEKPGDILVFQDTVNVPSVLAMTSAKAKTLGAKSLTNIVSRHNASGFMFYIRDVQLSANAVK